MRWVPIALYKLGAFIARTFPRAAVYWLAAGLSQCQYAARGDLRRAVRHNLARVSCPGPGPVVAPQGTEAKVRAVFRHFGWNIVDILSPPPVTQNALAGAALEGWHNLEAAAARGKGVIMLSAHFGNWEWGAMLVAQRGLPVNAVALDHRHPAVTQLFAERRRLAGVKTLPVEGSLFAILRALRRGEVVAIMADRDVAHQGIAAEFFGRHTLMPRAHASIALKTGAQIVPAFMERRGERRFVARFQPPVAAGDLRHDEAGVVTLMRRSIERLEAVIGPAPEHWLVFEPLWLATDPAGEPAGVAAVREAYDDAHLKERS